MTNISSTQTPSALPQQSYPAPAGPAAAALLPLLILLFVLVILIIGAGLLYVTLAHPWLATPLTVAVAGVTLIVTIAGAIAAFLTVSKR
ncbi:hypothetical protein ACIRRH_40010 [Kitasatospora sp. NPDC101235]|uniref:hypothetical protein n=1 Tax=Kitasatospora sp. NPDC101235 TaxID=3364101 RepID=UPI0037F89B6C